ncbi:Arc family DNA-binding protein [Acinetobacter puyangensis]|uniref:Arc family DNA-binding protein n=1 Tax=Acinetobacter puyangensis TaxID=1096779 RepID=UPI003A4D498C
MSREDPQLKVRLPQELKDKITESASSLGRSINADVVARLEQSFNIDSNTTNVKIPVDEIVEALAKRFNDSGLLNLSNTKNSEK